VNFTLAYAGFTVLKPFVAYGVEAGLRYSDASVVEGRLKHTESQLAGALKRLDQIDTVPFNRMADWGADGRVTPAAPAYSPFIRHKQHLTLE
jgi:NAD(P)H dehydrogenase (quinone)